jgi:hypothetical protein
MSTRRAATHATLAFLLGACQASSVDPGLYSFHPSPRRVSEPTSLVSVARPDVWDSIVRHPTPTVSPNPPLETLTPTSKPTPKPKPAPKVLGSVTGKASTYGDGYEGLLALPKSLGGRGEHVKICSDKTDRCIERVSNDVGPVESLHRVADLDASDFEYLCRCKWEVVGVQTVTVYFLD